LIIFPLFFFLHNKISLFPFFIYILSFFYVPYVPVQYVLPPDLSIRHSLTYDMVLNYTLTIRLFYGILFVIINLWWDGIFGITKFVSK